ncbi:hypothetical protein [Streptomyces sp. NPDC001480]|uniref:hypothetical protein n=1 Tax=Streptomyces sp. NPDC001480 TaxID=3364577 RepID=UPI0036CDF1AA
MVCQYAATNKDTSGATVADAPAPHMWHSAVNPAPGLPADDEQVTSRIEDTDDGQILVQATGERP